MSKLVLYWYLLFSVSILISTTCQTRRKAITRLTLSTTFSIAQLHHTVDTISALSLVDICPSKRVHVPADASLCACASQDRSLVLPVPRHGVTPLPWSRLPGHAWYILRFGNGAVEVLVASPFAVRSRVGNIPVWTLVLWAEISSWKHPTGFCPGLSVWLQRGRFASSDAQQVREEKSRSTSSQCPVRQTLLSYSRNKCLSGKVALN